MIAEIETGIVSFLQARWPQFGGATSVNEFDINLDFEDIVRCPALSVATERVGIKRMTGEKFDLVPFMGVYQVFKSPSKIDLRKLGVYPIVISVIQILLGQTLGITAIDGLVPVSCDEVSHEKLKELGSVCFRTVFRTAFTVNAIDMEDAVQLLSENLRYHFDTVGAIPEANDIVTL